MKIGFFHYEMDGTRYGGNVYDSMVADALSADHDVRVSRIVPWIRRTAKWPQQLVMTRRAEARSNRDLWIRDILGVAAMRTGSRRALNLALVHHVPERGTTVRQRLREPVTSLFLRHISRCDAVVVVSRYWKDYLERRGIGGVSIIYNAFDTERFRFAADEVDDLRRRLGLGNAPVVYVGNPQRAKGAVEVCHALRQSGAQLVASGVQSAALPARTFQLSYRDYRLLLAASNVVVTMSRFAEGWNRTAHEAMLCRTPVVGSGTGGMEELLTGGGQVICRDIADLRSCVDSALANAVTLGDAGYAFASQFTRERFAQQWRLAVSSLERSTRE